MYHLLYLHARIYEGDWHMIPFMIFSINVFLQILFCAACSFAKVVLVYQKIADENREFLDKNQLLTN